MSQADVIALVRAERSLDDLNRVFDTLVEFRVVVVIKGWYPAATIQFHGVSVDRDDFNDRSIPYDMARAGGRVGGNCFASTYRLGAEYLLLLRRGKPTGPFDQPELTPYWASLSPTNEQVSGVFDPWVDWVRQHVPAAIAP